MLRWIHRIEYSVFWNIFSLIVYRKFGEQTIGSVASIVYVEKRLFEPLGEFRFSTYNGRRSKIRNTTCLCQNFLGLSEVRNNKNTIFYK